MKNYYALLSLLMIPALSVFSQERYSDQIFTDDEIIVTSDVVYGANIRFIPPVDFESSEAQADVLELQTIAQTTGDYPAAYFDLADPATTVKLRALGMDVYEPDPAIDDVEERPVILYIHTGNFLPPPTNGSPTGTKTDSLAIVTCREYAKRGFVAISMEYRLGWNPVGDANTRRGTLLNAVYRAIQDTKECVRYIREDANQNGNTFAVDPNKIVLFGEGSGGYVALGYATVDDLPAEISVPKFIDPETGSSYVIPAVVGDENGFNGALTLYQDNGEDTEIQMTINLGGAMGDISWIEAGDAPMVSFHAIRDDFAPFDDGTVVVPTTQENVVDVSGSNVFIQAANDLGNNSLFDMIPDGDPFTDQARSFYGQGPIEISNGLNVTVSENPDPEGLFPVLLPLRPFLTNIASPWQWWDPESPFAQAVVGEVGGNPITAHQASLASNPNMSPEQGRTYLDTIQGYSVPRIMCALELPGNVCTTNTEDEELLSATNVFPNPSQYAVNIRNDEHIIRRVNVMDITGRVVVQKNVNDHFYTLDRGNLNDGVYLIQVVFDDTRITKKVMFN